MDIGGGWGDFALSIGRNHPQCRVIAFEPFPPSIELFEENRILNQVSNVELVHAAIGKESGKLRLSTQNKEAVQLSTADTKTGTWLEVESLSLADAMQNHLIERCDFLKMDCEGGEYDILFSAPDDVLARIDRICMESHDGMSNYNHTDLIHFLEGHGYRVRYKVNPVHTSLGMVFAIHNSIITKKSINLRFPNKRHFSVILLYSYDRTYTEFLYYCPCRPWQIYPGGPHAAFDRDYFRSRHNRAGPGYDGSGTGKGRYDKSVRCTDDVQGKDGVEYELNLIDTPGHVDFNYEVNRALAACEGALLVVDATQGIEAQTLANLYLALESDLVIIPIINKIDLISARPDEVAEDICALMGGDPEEVIRISAKDGLNVESVLEAVVKQVPARKAIQLNL